MKINNSTLEIDSGNPIKLDMTTEHPKIEIETTKPKIEIDQSQCFDECGLKSPSSLISEIVQYSRSIGLQAIGRIAEQGNELANIQNKENPIPRQAEYNRFGQYVYETNIGYMPASRPKINFIESHVDIRLVEGRVNNNTVYDPPKINFSPPSIDYYVDDYGSVEISTVDLKL